VKLVTAQQMQAIDRRTIDGGLVPALVLMENAGAALAREALRLLRRPRGARVEILCGKGNNGGDGLVLARLLAREGVRVCVHLCHPATELSSDARANLSRLRRSKVSINVLKENLAASPAAEPVGRRPRPLLVAADVPGRRDSLASHLVRADLCVDALLGTGAARPLAPAYAGLVDLLNRTSRLTLAVDIPTGVDASSGALLGTAVWADVTVTFGLPKLGLAFHPGRERAGRIEVADIGFPAEVLGDRQNEWSWVDPAWARALLRPLQPTAHKYSRGTVLMVAGSSRFPGAAALAAEAALRTGAGMVHLVVPGSIRDLLEVQLREVIIHPCPEDSEGNCTDAVLDLASTLAKRCDALALGSGIQADDSVRRWMRELLATLALPAVVDADALLALPPPPHPAPRVATPHAGELARWLGLEARLDEKERVTTAAAAATRHQVVVVAKGAPSVVVTPAGEKRVNSTGHTGLATAGSGDVLGGMLGSLLAQGLEAPAAATLAVYLHGLAAELACEQSSPRSLLAGDLLPAIGLAYATLERG